ncbi:MAG: hypothetical protein KA223_08370 [Candidatus Accumulibacter sp.]|jgi:hypothetical protein|nr:hypothetical protein [Accumulibacter sp.]
MQTATDLAIQTGEDVNQRSVVAVTIGPFFARGLTWLVRQERLFIPDFPTSAAITVVAGMVLMLWSAAQILRELARQRADSVRS